MADTWQPVLCCEPLDLEILGQRASLLNDNIINDYLQLVQARSRLGGLSVLSLDSFLLKDLVRRRFDVARSRVKNVNPFTFDLILVPYHRESRKGHWALLAVWTKKGRIESYDSMGYSNILQLYELCKLMKREAKLRNDDAQLIRWTVHDTPSTCPIQPNEWDCGTYTAWFAERLARGEPIQIMETPFSPGLWRRHMLYALRRKYLGFGVCVRAERGICFATDFPELPPLNVESVPHVVLVYPETKVDEVITVDLTQPPLPAPESLPVTTDGDSAISKDAEKEEDNLLKASTDPWIFTTELAKENEFEVDFPTLDSMKEPSISMIESQTSMDTEEVTTATGLEHESSELKAGTSLMDLLASINEALCGDHPPQCETSKEDTDMALEVRSQSPTLSCIADESWLEAELTTGTERLDPSSQFQTPSAEVPPVTSISTAGSASHEDVSATEGQEVHLAPATIPECGPSTSSGVISRNPQPTNTRRRKIKQKRPAKPKKVVIQFPWGPVKMNVNRLRPDLFQ